MYNEINIKKIFFVFDKVFKIFDLKIEPLAPIVGTILLFLFKEKKNDLCFLFLILYQLIPIPIAPNIYQNF